MKFKQRDQLKVWTVLEWLADSTLPRSYTETDESMICLDDIQLVELGTSVELNLTVTFLSNGLI